MAKLLDLLVAAEGFVPVAGRVYAQDDTGDTYQNPSKAEDMFRANGMWWGRQGVDLEMVTISGRPPYYCLELPLADDHTTAVITAEAILEARACQ